MCLADLPSSDLLTHLERTTRFLREGVEYGAVLVHCYHGVSRSAAVVAAYLMKTHHKWDADRAVAEIRKVRPSVAPNEGFMRQLKLFRSMSCRLDAGSKAFKMYKLGVIHEQVLRSGILPPPGKMLSLKEQQSSSSSPNSLSATPTSTSSSSAAKSRNSGFQTNYRCKKCRQVLVCQSQVLPHSKGESPSWESLLALEERLANTGREKENEGKNGTTSKSTSKVEYRECRQGIFVEPVKWMAGLFVGSGLADKLHCFKCRNKIGSYSWVGKVPCGCGGSMTPGLVINLNRVDKCTMLKEVEAVL